MKKMLFFAIAAILVAAQPVKADGVGARNFAPLLAPVVESLTKATVNTIVDGASSLADGISSLAEKAKYDEKYVPISFQKKYNEMGYIVDYSAPTSEMSLAKNSKVIVFSIREHTTDYAKSMKNSASHLFFICKADEVVFGISGDQSDINIFSSGTPEEKMAWLKEYVPPTITLASNQARRDGDSTE